MRTTFLASGLLTVAAGSPAVELKLEQVYSESASHLAVLGDDQVSIVAGETPVLHHIGSTGERQLHALFSSSELRTLLPLPGGQDFLAVSSDSIYKGRFGEKGFLQSLQLPEGDYVEAASLSADGERLLIHARRLSPPMLVLTVYNVNNLSVARQRTFEADPSHIHRPSVFDSNGDLVFVMQGETSPVVRWSVEDDTTTTQTIEVEGLRVNGLRWTDGSLRTISTRERWVQTGEHHILGATWERRFDVTSTQYYQEATTEELLKKGELTYTQSVRMEGPGRVGEVTLKPGPAAVFEVSPRGHITYPANESWSFNLSETRRVRPAVDDSTGSLRLIVADGPTGNTLARLPFHGRPFTAIAESPDSELVFLANRAGFGDSTTSFPVAFYRNTALPIAELEPKEHEIISLLVGPRWMVGAGHLQYAVWDAQTGQRILTVPQPAARIQLSPNGRYLATFVGPYSGNEVAVYDLDGLENGEMTVVGQYNIPGEGGIHGFTFLGNDQLVFTSFIRAEDHSGGTYFLERAPITDLNDRTELARLEKPPRQPPSFDHLNVVAASNDGSRLQTRTKILDVATMETLLDLGTWDNSVLSPDGRYVARVGESLQLLEVDSQQTIAVVRLGLPEHGTYWSVPVFSSDSKRLYLPRTIFANATYTPPVFSLAILEDGEQLPSGTLSRLLGLPTNGPTNFNNDMVIDAADLIAEREGAEGE